jgi:hypothetical protein
MITNATFIESYFLPILKTWIKETREKGMIPTAELLVEELESQVRKEKLQTNFK